MIVESTAKLSAPQKQRRRALIVPREHGAWGMLLVPLVTGAAVGLMADGRVAPVLLLTTAVLALFWLRTPVESWLGTSAVRVQTKHELQLVQSVALPVAALAAVSLCALFWRGKNRELISVGMIAGAAFLVQLVLKQFGRSTRMVAELIGALALTSTAPAAYCVATGRLDKRLGCCGWSTRCSPATRFTSCGLESMEQELQDWARSSKLAGVSWRDRCSSVPCWYSPTTSNGYQN